MFFFFFLGQAESSLDKLKTDYVCPWIFQIKKKYDDILISCLLPHPLDYVRVGGNWLSIFVTVFF